MIVAVRGFTGELESRNCEVVQTHFGDGGLHFYQRGGPWEFVLSDFRLYPGVRIKDGRAIAEPLSTAINHFSRWPIMTSDPQDARRNLPKALRHLPILRKPSGSSKFAIAAASQCCRLLAQEYWGG